MKTAYFQILILVFLSLFFGCKEEAAKDHLSISKEKVCLSYQGQEQCINRGGTYRLRLVEGKPVLEVLELGEMLVQPSYPQFSRPDAIKAEKLGVIIENKVLSLQDGERTIRDSTGLGIIMVCETNGTISCMMGSNPQVKPQRFAWDRSGMLAGTNVRKLSFSADLSTTFMRLSRTYFAYGDAANHYIPNDTGTEVVIIDNFKVVGDCNVSTADECCPSGAPQGPDIDVTAQMIDDYAADGLQLLACFPVNSICTFTDGDKLIVLVCDDQARYCLDYSVCDVSITTSDAGICISVPVGCEIENPFL